MSLEYYRTNRMYTDTHTPRDRSQKAKSLITSIPKRHS